MFDVSITGLINGQLRQLRGVGNPGFRKRLEDAFDLFGAEVFEFQECGVCGLGKVACFLYGFEILIHASGAEVFPFPRTDAG